MEVLKCNSVSIVVKYFVCAFYVSIWEVFLCVTFPCLAVCEYIRVFADSNKMWHFPVVPVEGQDACTPDKNLECLQIFLRWHLTHRIL